MGKKKEKSSSSSTSTNTLSPWSQNQFNTQTAGILDTVANYNKNTPYQPYTGELVAGLSPTEERARTYAFDNMGAGAGLLADSERVTKDALAYDGSDVSNWMNPYTDNVITATSDLYDEDLAGKISDNQARATMNGSYGGSRHGVMDAELNRTSALDKAKMVADLKHTGFLNAQQQGRANQAAQFQGAGILGTLSGEKQRQIENDVALMERLGLTERQIADARLLAEKAQYDEKAADEWRRMQLELTTRMGLLSATPQLVNTSATGEGVRTTHDPWGAASGLLGAVSSFPGLGER